MEAEEDVSQAKRSRTGRVIVRPVLPEEATTPAEPRESDGVKKRGAGRSRFVESASPEEATGAKDTPHQKGRRKASKVAKKAQWPPATAEQLAAAQKVMLLSHKPALADKCQQKDDATVM